MARVTFNVPESGEKSYKLTSQRAVSIGRDPGNDVVLRDPKVSRHHARIVFERGFFVLHDLSSSNGSFVNGRKVRVAPLTDRAELKLGNCIGYFSEELDDQDKKPTETRLEGAHPSAAKTVPDIELATAPHEVPKTEPGDEPPPDEKSKFSTVERPATEVKPPFSGAVPSAPVPAVDKPDRYLIDLRNPEKEISAIRDEKETPLFFFRNPVSLLGFVARLVAAMVTVSGAATMLFLFWQQQTFPALISAVLTIGFIITILMMVPRQQIVLYSDSDLSSIALMLMQESRFSFPALRFTLRKADGSIIGGFQKNLASNFGRRRWWILDRLGAGRIGYAKEESLPRALVRLIIATVRTNFRIYFHGREIGHVTRRVPVRNHFLLDLRNDPSQMLDRRLAIGLAVLIDAVEGR